MKYKVVHIGITDTNGDLRRKDEVLDAFEIVDAIRLLELGAIEPAAEVIVEAPIKGDEDPPEGDEKKAEGDVDKTAEGGEKKPAAKPKNAPKSKK